MGPHAGDELVTSVVGEVPHEDQLHLPHAEIAEFHRDALRLVPRNLFFEMGGEFGKEIVVGRVGEVARFPGGHHLQEYPAGGFQHRLTVPNPVGLHEEVEHPLDAGLLGLHRLSRAKGPPAPPWSASLP